MTDKHLSGSSREAMNFIASHWRDLLKMSILPFAAYLALAIYQIRSMGSLYRNMGSMVEGQTINPEFMGAYMRGMALSMLGSLVAMCLMGILFAQIIRFHKSGVAQWLITDKAGLSAGLLTLVYGIGIALLTMLAYIAGAIGFAIMAVIVGLIFGAVFGTSVVAGVLGVILAIIAVFAFLAGLYWFMCRFLVGLPGVALGSSPDFFKDMWPLSREETWGLPLRLLLATLVAYVPMMLILVIFIGPGWFDMISKMAQPENANNPNLMFPLMADMMEGMLPATAAMTLIYMPFMWFVTLLLGIAFQRFRGRAA